MESSCQCLVLPLESIIYHLTKAKVSQWHPQKHYHQLSIATTAENVIQTGIAEYSRLKQIEESRKSFCGSHVNNFIFSQANGIFRSISILLYCILLSYKSGSYQRHQEQHQTILQCSRPPDHRRQQSARRDHWRVNGQWSGAMGQDTGCFLPQFSAPFGYLWFVASLESELISRTSCCQQAVIARSL